MKTSFTPAEIMANRGCYERHQVEYLSFYHRDSITITTILESEISIKDKRWFVYNKCELSLNQKKELSFLLAEIVADIYNKKYPEDNRVNNCLQAIRDFNSGKISREELIQTAAAAYAAYAAADAAAADAAAAYAAAAYAAAYAADAAAAAYAVAAYAAADAGTYSSRIQSALIKYMELHSKQ